MNDIIIIGGGLSGLVNAIRLAGAGLKVLVIEKKQYPFHRVCGEYISNESLSFLKSIGANPDHLGSTKIRRLLVSSPSGTTLRMNLDMGGFGVSRFSFDNYLYTLALSKGVEFKLCTSVLNIKFNGAQFFIHASDNQIEEAKIVIGSYGKRSNLDRHLGREFFKRKSPYLAVKYHIRTDFPDDLIALHNFKDGYCGISKIEGDKYCLCYMTSRENLKLFNHIEEMERMILHRNPYLKNIFETSHFLFDEPEVINEISFETKAPVEHHIFMSGDAAGMITPLCGNGMSMAIHSAKILSELIIQNYNKGNFNRDKLESDYKLEWKRTFERRLFIGRKIQQLFGKEFLTDIAVGVLKYTPPLARWMVKQTHGEVF